MSGECEICGKPGQNVGYAGILCEKHNLKKALQTKCGVKEALPKYRSYAAEIKLSPTSHAKSFKQPPYPEGYISWRKFYTLHGKAASDSATFRKLKEAGLADVFMGDRIVKAGTPWPTPHRGRGGNLKARIAKFKGEAP